MGRPRTVWLIPLLLAPLGLTACGSDYPVFHPAGPVATMELRLIVLSTVIVAVIIVLVFVLWAIVLILFRDTPNTSAPFWPEWDNHRGLEIAVFILPIVALAVLAVPTVMGTYRLAYVPSRHPLVIDVTALDYKWVFEYPTRHIATVNYFDVPTGRPLLFELTSRSPMATLWAPNLGGMEYAMPNRVLPLWLEANRQGTYLGRNGNYDGLDYWRMTFLVHAVSPASFNDWVRRIRHTKPAMTRRDWANLSQPGIAQPTAFSSYPTSTFPRRVTEFTVKGLYYAPAHKP